MVAEALMLCARFPKTGRIILRSLLSRKMFFPYGKKANEHINHSGLAQQCIRLGSAGMQVTDDTL